MDAAVHDTTEAPRTTLYASAGGGSVLDEAGGAAPSATSSLRLALPLGRWAALEGAGTSGYVLGRGTPDDYWLRLAIGVRVEDAQQALRPYAALRLVHVHFAPVSTWQEHPGASIAGSSTEGLQHRSGSALAGGVTWALPHGGGWRAMAEGELSWVPIGDPPAWFVSVEAGVGYPF
jgi:hypothetical protein